MNTLAERIKYTREIKNLSQNDVATRAGISQPTYFKIESGLTKKPRNILELAQALGVNPTWLATGKGEMHAKSSIDGQPLSEVVVKNVEFWEGEAAPDDDEFEVPYYKDIELLGGDGRLPSTDDGRRKIKYGLTAARTSGASPNHVICLTLRGDSMEELIRDGSMVAVDRSKTDIREGKIYAFSHGELLRIKYLIKRPDGSLLIRSHNPKYADEIVTGEELNSIHIIGWVWNWSVMERW